MLKIHLAAGLMLATSSAAWGWIFGWSAWEVLCLYTLVGNVGLLSSVAVRLSMGAQRRKPELNSQESQDAAAP
jgi:hypothetical protein